MCTREGIRRCPCSCTCLLPRRDAAPTPSSLAGPNPRFRDEVAVYRQLRERYLLFANCVEAAPGKEPTAAAHPYLYPQAPVAAAPHH